MDGVTEGRPIPESLKALFARFPDFTYRPPTDRPECRQTRFVEEDGMVERWVWETGMKKGLPAGWRLDTRLTTERMNELADQAVTLVPSPDERREAAIEAAAKAQYESVENSCGAPSWLYLTAPQKAEWIDGQRVALAAYDAALGAEAEPTEAEIEAAAWEQHNRDGHGYHPDDPHYCWPEHRDEYRRDARRVLIAGRAARRLPPHARSEHPEQSVEPGEKESNTTTSAEHPDPRDVYFGSPSEHPETGERACLSVPARACRERGPGACRRCPGPAPETGEREAKRASRVRRMQAERAANESLGQWSLASDPGPPVSRSQARDIYRTSFWEGAEWERLSAGEVRPPEPLQEGER